MDFWSIICIAGGAVVGGVLGYVRFGKVVSGVVVGAVGALILTYVLGVGPARLIAVGTADEFQDEVLNSDLPVLVDFYADWCGPCRKLAPTIDELAGEYSGRVKVVKVNVDVGKALAACYNVRGIPCVMLFVNGQVVNRIIGAAPKDVYRRIIDAALNKP